MAGSITNYTEFEQALESRWRETPLFGFFLHDSRKSHQSVVRFLEESAQWLDELAVQSGVYILFPLQRESGRFHNPSPVIAREFGLQPNRLPGVVLFATADGGGRLGSSHFLFVPLKDADFAHVERMQAAVADLFSMAQQALSDGANGHGALERIRADLSRRRKRQAKDAIIEALRSGAQVVLKQFPEKFITSFGESLGKALGGGVGK